MKHIFKFKIKGSAQEPYEVVFDFKESNLTATCSCPAGSFGTYCKHRMKVMAEPLSSKFFQDFKNVEIEKLSELRKLLQTSDVWEPLIEFIKADKTLEQAKADRKKAQKAFEKSLNN
ncbi:MAG: SWIM zinc finger family protein [Nitrospinae bacterium]|nr:SWIM zinc finger family protein [Nitrospinota bacterium]